MHVTYEDDEFIERFREAMEYQRKRHEAVVLEVAEQSLGQVATDSCPPPLSWHPYYRGKTWLIDWLNGKSDIPEWDIRIPIIERRSVFAESDIHLARPSMRTLHVTKRRAWGLAPWVGRPFHYEWYIGTDELGRHIAGESRIIYEPAAG